jgi:assimilatory nitrate reductase catalytic subunit
MPDGSTLQQVRTTCPYCGVGCGVLGAAEGGRSLAVAGDPAHPANFGRLCSKGAALGATASLAGRLLEPEVHGRRVTWPEATAFIAKGLQQVIRRHGPDAVAFYVSGQLLTEDYYVANKLMKGFIGSANIDTNSRLCMASAVAAHKQAFGEDLVPGCYEDLELADLVVFAGHNAAFTHPVLVRRMEQARARGQRWAVIDPRRTETAEDAVLHLPLAPQSDVRLWNGLLADLIRRGAVDRGFIASHVAGFAEVEAALCADDQSPAAVARDCGLELAALERFFAMFAQTPRTVTLFSQGVNQSAQGVAKALAILNVHLATGRIGKPGACPFSITGQPNAMGGREVGGMANTLAAHMDFDDASRRRVARFWSAPRIAARPGLKAVDMFEAVADGRIKAIWIMATNPAVSLPRSAGVAQALARCPLVIVSDCMAETDTLALAHVKLPALAWGERDGTVTNSERRISRQRPLLRPPGQARADWRIVRDVAAAMGHGDAFHWRSPAAVFREYVRMTAFENAGAGRRELNLGPLLGQDYDALQPVQWPVGAARLFADGCFPTPDGRANMVPVRPAGPAEAPGGVFPLSLNTGRLRDHWHTLTRTGRIAELSRGEPEPFVEVHPEDAAAAGVLQGALTRVITANGAAVARARISDRQRRGGLFMPMHWSAAFAISGRANPLVGQARDPVSGQPEFKHTPARIRPYGETWRGFFIARDAWTCPPGLELVWRRTTREGCVLHQFAGRGDAEERAALRKILRRSAPRDAVALEDPCCGSLREAFVDAGGRLERALFMAAAAGRLPSPDWLASLFTAPSLSPAERSFLLHGCAPGATAEAGAQVCACMGVGENLIRAAIAKGACDEEAVGRATRAGVTCGACRPQIRQLIRQSAAKEPAHAA